MLPMMFSENLFDDLFNDAFGRTMWNADKALYGKNAARIMKTDVHETEDSYELAVDLPGFKKDEIGIELKDGYLTITASKGVDKEEEDKKTRRVIRQERFAGTSQRTFYVGDVRPEEVRCRYESGVLMIEVPKKDARRVESPHTIMIEG